MIPPEAALTDPAVGIDDRIPARWTPEETRDQFLRGAARNGRLANRLLAAIGSVQVDRPTALRARDPAIVQLFYRYNRQIDRIQEMLDRGLDPESKDEPVSDSIRARLMAMQTDIIRNQNELMKGAMAHADRIIQTSLKCITEARRLELQERMVGVAERRANIDGASDAELLKIAGLDPIPGATKESGGGKTA